MSKMWSRYNLVGKVFICLPIFTMATICYLGEKGAEYITNRIIDRFVK